MTSTTTTILKMTFGYQELLLYVVRQMRRVKRKKARRTPEIGTQEKDTACLSRRYMIKPSRSCTKMQVFSPRCVF
mgnify:CR=1 FL=1